ncbi:MAG: flagellar motor protein MotB [Desulfamplus sp.]|nr:flagellar motor protein MotB [Desulfamplus sp.]
MTTQTPPKSEPNLPKDTQTSEPAKTAEQDSRKGSSSLFSDNYSSFSDDPFADDLLLYAVEANSAKWSVSWSDLMMTMFIFFAVLYIYKSGNRELEFGHGQEKEIHGQETSEHKNPGQQNIADSASGSIMEKKLEHKPSEIYDQALKALKDKWVNESVSVELVKDQAVRLTLSSDLFFDIGKADLKPEAKWELKNVADFLKENSFVINVAGHTDSVPNHSVMFPTNWELSAARACKVARFLIENEGVEENRFFVSGHSWLQPVAPNNSPSNRALNRRVEILLIKEMPYER